MTKPWYIEVYKKGEGVHDGDLVHTCYVENREQAHMLGQQILKGNPYKYNVKVGTPGCPYGERLAVFADGMFEEEA